MMEAYWLESFAPVSAVMTRRPDNCFPIAATTPFDFVAQRLLSVRDASTGIGMTKSRSSLIR